MTTHRGLAIEYSLPGDGEANNWQGLEEEIRDYAVEAIIAAGGTFEGGGSGPAGAEQAESDDKDKPESNLVAHARRELELCGQMAEDPEYSRSIIAAVEGFTSYYGHSGGSASVAREQLYKLLGFEPLSPLTSDPDEWLDVSEMSGRPMWQNRRDPRAFSDDGGKTWWVLDEDGSDADA